VLFLFLPLFYYRKPTFNNNKKTKNTMESEKLFDDTMFVQKERPTGITSKQEEDLFVKLANEIIDDNYSNSDVDRIVCDLKELSLNDTGFEMAKHLEDYGQAEYRIDGSFIDWLDDYGWEWRDLARQNVRLWVKAHEPKNKFEKGVKLILTKDLNWTQRKGDVVYLNGIQEAEANYLVDKDPARSGGTVIAYEKLESCCEIFEELEK
jgi:hypothetical protein